MAVVAVSAASNKESPPKWGMRHMPQVGVLAVVVAAADVDGKESSNHPMQLEDRWSRIARRWACWKGGGSRQNQYADRETESQAGRERERERERDSQD